MRWTSRIFRPVMFALLLLSMNCIAPIRAYTSWTPAATVVIRMRRLLPGGIDAGTGDCAVGDSSFGCTYSYSAFGSYPYATNPAVVDIENDYLRDVVSMEMDPADYNHSDATLSVQAIASRSYTHWHIENNPGAIVNSNAFQVFVPYKFESLSSNAQQRLLNAIAEPYYLSASFTDVPARADFDTAAPNLECAAI